MPLESADELTIIDCMAIEDIIPEAAVSSSLIDDKNLIRDIRDIRSSINLAPHPYQETQVYVLAVHKDRSKNIAHKIDAHSGVPIGGYMYDGQNECYLVNCVDFLPIGYVTISYTISIKDSFNWKITIPLPESVLKRYMSEQQKSDLKRFKSDFVNDYYFDFVQLIKA